MSLKICIVFLFLSDVIGNKKWFIRLLKSTFTSKKVISIVIKSKNKAQNRKKFENNGYIIFKNENEIFSPYRINYQVNEK